MDVDIMWHGFVEKTTHPLIVLVLCRNGWGHTLRICGKPT